MDEPPKKERYVIYVSPDVGAALRNEKAAKRGMTYSDIAEQTLRQHYALLASRPAKSA